MRNIQVKKNLINASKILIIISRPIDNDSIASGIVLRNNLVKRGKKVTLLSPNDIPIQFKTLPLINSIKVQDSHRINFSQFDCIVALDGGNTKQFALVDTDKEFQFGGHKNILNIDHHFGNSHFAHFELVDVSCSSTVEVMLKYGIINISTLAKSEATLFYAGLVGDTGCFKYNTNVHTFKYASQLIKKGANNDFCVHYYFYNNRKKDFEALAYLINKTVYYEKLGYSLVSINLDEENDHFSENELREGARLYENYCSRAVQEINVTFVIIKRKKEMRVSMRGNNYTNKIPVPEIGKKLGGEGGGHFNAGGVTLFHYKKDIITDINAIMKLLRSYYKQK